MEFKEVNKSVLKVDGLSLACGTAKFTADYNLTAPLVAKILQSPIAHGYIEEIDVREAKEIPGVIDIITYKDIPRVPHTTAGQGAPEPSPYDCYLLDRKVRFVGDKVAIVAGETEEVALKALSKIKVKFKELPPVFSPKEALLPGAPVIHDEEDSTGIYDAKRNLAGFIEVKIGDVKEAIEKSDAVVEGEFYYHISQHCPIEPHAVLSFLDENGRLVIITTTQVPFHVRRIVARVLKIPVKKIRVIKPRIGGGFGVKQEVFLEPVVGIVTLRTGRCAKLEYTRKEEFNSSRTRHGMYIKTKMASTKEGKLTLLSMDVISNTGAYGGHALTVASNTGSKVLPLYQAPVMYFRTQIAYTNLIPAGAYRGYGATQGYFATESMIDMLAEKLNMDPLEIRRKNHIDVGGSSPIFKILGEGREGVEQVIKSCALEECLKIGAEKIKWWDKPVNDPDNPIKEGLGMAMMMQGSSIPFVDMGGAFIKMNEDGSFNLLIGATDLGTGSDTVLSQIAAEALSVDTEDIIVYSSDTDFTPFDVGAYASSTTYLSGNAVKEAADKVKEQILQVAGEILGEPIRNLYCINKKVKSHITGKEVSYERIACYSLYEHNQFQIMGSSSAISTLSPPPFAAHFVRLTVDTETGKIKLLKYVAAVDCGTPINPQLAEGQVEGAIVQGLSHALYENYIFDKKGKIFNTSFRYYKIPTALDIPEIEVILVPSYEPTGPYGAKSISEIGINGPAPAIANAIYNATGVRLYETSFTGEKILKALGKI